MKKCRIEGTANTLLARRLKAADPDAKHPGKAEEISQGKACFRPGNFPAFWGQKPTNSRNPNVISGTCLVYSIK